MSNLEMPPQFDHPLDPALVAKLKTVTTATLTTVLLKKGLRNVWVRGAKPLAADYGRLVARAFTLRFVPSREDLATPASWASPISTRTAIEAMPKGCLAIVDAMGVQHAGIFGDILCARMANKEVAGLITDGVVRDLDGVIRSKLKVWCSGVAAPASVAGLTFVDWQRPIGCGGVAIFPGDLLVADADGVVVVPWAMVDEVAELAIEQERLEEWIMTQIEAGAALPGMYPINDANKARYAEYRKLNP